MKNKVIFFDVDGTLWYMDEVGTHFDHRLIEEFKRLKACGYYLVIATGRPYAAITKQLKDLEFDGYILSNGAQIVLDGKTVFEKRIPRHDMEALIKVLRENECEYVLETITKNYLDPSFTLLYDFLIKCMVEPSNIIRDFDENEILDEIVKVEMSRGLENEMVASHLDQYFNYDHHAAANAFECYSKFVTKATGVEKFIEIANIPLRNTIAFGDGVNDLEMIQFVQRGIAMGNSMPSLKEVADEICGDVKDGGLYEALQKIS